MALIYAVTAEERVRVRTGGRARAWQGGPPRLILGRQMHRRQRRPPALFQRSVCVFLSVRLPACAHISVRVCVCVRARDGPSVSLSVEVELRSPLSIHYSTPLHSLFGFCQRSLTVTLVDSYCSSLRSPPLPPCQPGPICCVGDDGRMAAESDGTAPLQQDPFSSVRPGRRRVCRAMSASLPLSVSLCGLARPSFLSSCLMTTLAGIGFPPSFAFLLRSFLQSLHRARSALFCVMRCRPRDNVSPPW